MGKASRDKGLRRERAIVDLHSKCGIRAERVPLSGAMRYRGNGADVDIYVRGAAPLKAEVKARGAGAGFKTLERWLGENDVLLLVRDRATPLVVLTLPAWLDVAGRSAAAADGDRERIERRRLAEQGPLPPVDAIAEHAA